MRLETLQRERAVLARQAGDYGRAGRSNCPPEEGLLLTAVPGPRKAMARRCGYTSDLLRLISDDREGNTDQIDRDHKIESESSPISRLSERDPASGGAADGPWADAVAGRSDGAPCQGTRTHCQSTPCLFRPGDEPGRLRQKTGATCRGAGKVKDQHERLRNPSTANAEGRMRPPIHTAKCRPSAPNIDDALEENSLVEQGNRATFFKTSKIRRLLQRLFTKTFHAYLAGSVFARSQIRGSALGSGRGIGRQILRDSDRARDVRRLPRRNTKTRAIGSGPRTP